ncbi:MAG: hypothetical protein ACREA0_02155, partial [bacterium]
VIAGVSFFKIHAKPHLFHWFLGCYVPMFYIYPVLAPIADLPMPSAGVVLQSYTLLTVGGLHLFCLGFEIRWAMNRITGPSMDLKFVPMKRVRMIFYCGLILNLAAVGLLLLDTEEVASLWTGSRVDRKIAMGPLSLASVYLLTLGSFQYLCLATYAGRRWMALWSWLILLVAVEAVLFLAFRARTIFVLHSVAFLYGWLILNRSAVTLRKTDAKAVRRLWGVFRMVTAAIAVFVVAAQLRVSRGFVGSEEFVSSLLNIRDAVWLSIRNGELGYAPVVFDLLEIVPEREKYLRGQSYYRVLLAVVPRDWWPEKPLSTERIVGGWLRPGVEEQTIAPGIVGDLYVNFGIAGIAVLVLYGWIFASLGASRGLADRMFVGTAFPGVFHFVRGAVTSPVIVLAILWLSSRLVARYLETGEVVAWSSRRRGGRRMEMIARLERGGSRVGLSVSKDRLESSTTARSRRAISPADAVPKG